MFSQLKNGIERELENYFDEKGIENFDIKKVSGILLCLMEGFHIYSIFMEKESDFESLSGDLIATALGFTNKWD